MQGRGVCPPGRGDSPGFSLHASERWLPASQRKEKERPPEKGADEAGPGDSGKPRELPRNRFPSESAHCENRMHA